MVKEARYPSVSILLSGGGQQSFLNDVSSSKKPVRLPAAGRGETVLAHYRIVDAVLKAGIGSLEFEIDSPDPVGSDTAFFLHVIMIIDGRAYGGFTFVLLPEEFGKFMPPEGRSGKKQ